MPEQKSLPTSFRVSARFREALKAAAERERRSFANMLEVMVFDYCDRHGVLVSGETKPSDRAKKTEPADDDK